MHSNLQLILSVFLTLFLCLCSLWLSVEKCQKQFIIVSCENAISNFTCTNGQLRCTHCTKAAKETRALAQNPKPATTITTTTTTRLYRVTRGRRSVGQSQGRGRGRKSTCQDFGKLHNLPLSQGASGLQKHFEKLQCTRITLISFKFFEHKLMRVDFYGFILYLNEINWARAMWG